MKNGLARALAALLAATRMPSAPGAGVVSCFCSVSCALFEVPARPELREQVLSVHSAVGSRLREREVVEFLLRLVDPAEHDRRLLCGEAVLRLDHLSGHRIELVSNVVETCLDAGDFFFDRVQLRAVAVGKERADEVADAFADRPQLTGLQFFHEVRGAGFGERDRNLRGGAGSVGAGLRCRRGRYRDAGCAGEGERDACDAGGERAGDRS